MPGIHFEDEAQMFAYKAWDTLKLEPPCNLDIVAQRLGLEIHTREFEEGIDGIYLRLPGAPPIIAINNLYVKPHARKRFTLAHEIGHHLLCRKINEGKRLFFFDTLNTKRTSLERSCDRFAALLLMPDHLIKKHFDDLAFNPDQRLNVLATRFDVSVWAMKRRLSELKLVDNPRRFRPKPDRNMSNY